MVSERSDTGDTSEVELAVYLGYAAPRGHALIDRELYLPDLLDSCAEPFADAGP